MAAIVDFAIDVTGFMLATAAWVMMIFVPIEVTVIALLRRHDLSRAEGLVGVAVSTCVSVLVAFFLKWVAAGIFRPFLGNTHSL